MNNTYTIYWAKTNPNAIIPTKEEGDAGFDIYACIDHDYSIAPGTTRMIPTGIAYQITEGWHLFAWERGSTAKLTIKKGAGCNDNSFRGEIQAFIYNGTIDKTIIISKDVEATKKRLLAKFENKLREKYGDDFYPINQEKFFSKYIIYPDAKAILQLVPLYSPDGTSCEVFYEELSKTARGAKMLGSTNKA